MPESSTSRRRLSSPPWALQGEHEQRYSVSSFPPNGETHHADIKPTVEIHHNKSLPVRVAKEVKKLLDAITENPNKPIGIGKKLTPSDVERLIREALHNATDYIHQYQEQDGDNMASLMGSMYHSLARIALEELLKPSHEPPSAQQLAHEFLMSKDTYLEHEQLSELYDPGQPEAFFARTGDGLEIKSALEFYSRLNGSFGEAEVNLRLAILYKLKRELSAWDEDKVKDKKLIADFRDAIFGQLQNILTKLEIIIMHLRSMLVQNLERIEAESTIQVSYEFNGPFIFTNLNPNAPSSFEGVRAETLTEQDMLVIDYLTISNGDVFATAIEVGDSYVLGSVSFHNDEIRISNNLLKYCVFRYQDGTVSKNFYSNKVLNKIFVSPKNPARLLNNIKSYLGSGYGTQLKIGGQQLLAQSHSYYRFTKIPLQQVRAFAVCRPDLAVVFYDQQRNRCLHITDYKTNYSHHGDLAQDVSVAIYLLNSIMYYLERPNTRVTNGCIRILGIDATDPTFWGTIKHHLRNTFFSYLDLNTGELIDYHMSPDRVLYMLRVMKYVVELKIMCAPELASMAVKQPGILDMEI